MNSLAEALGMQLPGSAAIPAPYRQRQHMAYETGKRIVELVRQDVRPSSIMTRDAFLNAIVVNSPLVAQPMRRSTWPPLRAIWELSSASMIGRPTDTGSRCS